MTDRRDADDAVDGPAGTGDGDHDPRIAERFRVLDRATPPEPAALGPVGSAPGGRNGGDPFARRSGFLVAVAASVVVVLVGMVAIVAATGGEGDPISTTPTTSSSTTSSATTSRATTSRATSSSTETTDVATSTTGPASGTVALSGTVTEVFTDCVSRLVLNEAGQVVNSGPVSCDGGSYIIVDGTRVFTASGFTAADLAFDKHPSNLKPGQNVSVTATRDGPTGPLTLNCDACMIRIG